MARFYGTVQGGRGQASRLGHASTGLRVSAQSHSGDIDVQFYVRLEDETDMVRIKVKEHGGGYLGKVLYNGPVADLLDRDARSTMITALASDILVNP